jgi:hypothetical protein
VAGEPAVPHPQRRQRHCWRATIVGTASIAATLTLAGCGGTEQVATATTVPTTLAASSPTDAALPPQQRGRVTISALLISRNEERTALVDVVLRGELPDPCHRLAWMVRQTGRNYEIDAWSVPADGGEDLCVAAVQPFEEVIPLGELPPGTHTVTAGEHLATVEV